MGLEADHGRRRRRRPGPAAGRTAARRRGAGQGVERGGPGRARRGVGRRWPRQVTHETDPHRRRHRADGVDPADPGADPAVHPAGLRPRDPRGRPAQPPDQARHAVDGRGGDHRRHLGRLPRHPPGRAGVRRRGPVGLRAAGAGAGHRARRRRVRRRPDQDPQVAQPGAEQDRQDRRPDHRRGAVRRAGAAVPQRRRADAGQRRAVLRARDRHRHTGSGAVRAVLRGAWSAPGPTR